MERKISRLRPMVGRLNRMLDRRFETAYLPLFPIDIGPQQGWSLAYICKHPGCKSNSIMDGLMLKKSTVSEILTLLENEGFISSSIDKDDKRIKKLYPTEKGMQYYQSTKKVLDKFEKELSSMLEEDEKNEFLRIGEKILDKLEEGNKNGR